MSSFNSFESMGLVDYLEPTDTGYANYCNDRAIKGESEFILTREAFNQVVESRKRIFANVDVSEVSDSSEDSDSGEEENDDEILTFILSRADEVEEDDEEEVLHFTYNPDNDEKDADDALTLTDEDIWEYDEVFSVTLTSDDNSNNNNEGVNIPRRPPTPPGREVMEGLLESYLEMHPEVAATRGGVEEVMNTHREALDAVNVQTLFDSLADVQNETLRTASTFQPINTPSETVESYREWMSDHPTAIITFDEYCDVIRDTHSMRTYWKSQLPAEPKHLTLKNSWSGEEPYESEFAGHKVAWLRNEENIRFIACVEELPAVNDLDLPDGVLRGVDVYRKREGTWYEQVDGSWVFEFDRREGEAEGSCVVENEEEFDEQTLYANLTNIDLRGLDRVEQE